jgi:ATP-dependent RNA helicase DDX31/DBP7
LNLFMVADSSVKAKQAARRVVKAHESGKPSQQVPSAPARASKPTREAPKPAPRPEVVTPTYAKTKPVVRPTKPAPHAPVIPAPKKAKTQPQPQERERDSSPEAGPSRLPMEPAAPAAKNSQIISSLFTGNPHLPRVHASEVAVGAPSNAPLDTSTFKGLGLDPLLVHHLQAKMGIKAPTGIQKACLPYMLSHPLDVDARVDDDDDDDYETQGTKEVAVAAGPRDVFIQSQTGSGKTLSYLLPVIQALLPLSKLSYIDRSIGTLAIILAPTRELAQQIAKVVESVLTMALSLADDEEDRGYTRWLVSGLLVGGGTRTHDKARLRKGVPILVATPGRLLDHLQNTSSFQCAKTMFLVLDEADRLMDLGFEETIQGILKALDGRRRNEINAEREGEAGMMRWPYWSRGRQTVLCSATVDAKVERLAGMTLRDPVTFRPSEKEKRRDVAVVKALEAAGEIEIPDADDKFTPPSQLAQRYVVAPTKLRLVTLVALLRSLVGKGKVEASEDGTKVIVFLSSTDAVDYHFRLLAGVTMGAPAPAADDDEEEEEEGEESADEGSDSEGGQSKPKPKKAKAKAKPDSDTITLTSALFPNTTIHRLHGSLPLKTRLASLKAFATPSPESSILLATSVASRGLDLPLVRAVVQYDLPTEGGGSEYVHRIGRTARAGAGGEAWAFVAPAEAEWVPWVEGKMGAATKDEGSVRLQQVGVEDVLRKGFGGRGHEYEARATDVQLAFERWVLGDDKVSCGLKLIRRGDLADIRTRPSRARPLPPSCARTRRTRSKNAASSTSSHCTSATWPRPLRCARRQEASQRPPSPRRRRPSCPAGSGSATTRTTRSRAARRRRRATRPSGACTRPCASRAASSRPGVCWRRRAATSRSRTRGRWRRWSRSGASEQQ